MHNYQAYFYLLAGVSAYVFILMGLRLLGLKGQDEKVQSVNEENKWISKEELRIVDIIDEGLNVKTFRFKRVNGERFSVFAPGQFLSFQIKDDVKLLRSYSISGSCENTSTLQVSIKHIKDGVGSGWFHSLKKGDFVMAFPPGGHFTDEREALEQQRVFVGGGIGITPLISMIKTAIDRSTGSPMALFYGMASTKDLVFHEELLNLAATYKNFKYYPILSPGAKGWDGDTGYINYDYILSKMDLSPTDQFYFCGPPIMTDSISESLLSHGHESGHIHSEKFASPVSFDEGNIPKRQVQVKIKAQSLAYDGKESLLEFLEDNNVEINFACRSGVCGECKCKLISGKVDSITDSGLTALDKKEGHILTCVSRPLSDIELDV